MSKTPVSSLQEYTARRKLELPVYDIIDETNGTHLASFTYRATSGSSSAVGTASNKKDAKHNAARELLKILKRGTIPSSPGSPSSLSPSFKQTERNDAYYPGSAGETLFVNSVGKLGEYCMQRRLMAPNYEVRNCSGPAHNMSFTVICSIAKLKTEATASTKKQAKQDAAQNMLRHLVQHLPSNIELISDKKIRNVEQEVENKLRHGLETLNLKIEPPKIPVGESSVLASQLFPKLRKNGSEKVLPSIEVRKYHGALKALIGPGGCGNVRREIQEIPSLSKAELLQRIATVMSTKLIITVLATTAHGSAVCCELHTNPTLRDIGVAITLLDAKEKACSNMLSTLEDLLM